DPSITRGLDYYTGIVLETQLAAIPEIGSVCSGGRYDELASLYTTRRMPGVGASVGLDRLLAALDALGRNSHLPRSTAILIINQEGNALSALHETSSRLRSEGFATEVYPEPRKLASQYAYAERKHIPLALFLNSDRESKESVRPLYLLRVLARRENIECEDLGSVIRIAAQELVHA
ncbi:MAG: ATP phosphoribosyltransferase regulatory subunit, partial [Rectinema sp.]|nr:ATP phosphoribosyltransferase regulatory subunit [Rectinema sp.]